MRRAGRLFSPCFTLVSRTFHARSLLPSSRCVSLERCQPLRSPPKAANQYKTAPTWIPNSAPPPPSATSAARCLAGLVGVVKVIVSPGETIVA